MIKRLRSFFSRQTAIGRLIWAIVLPLILFILFYNIAEGQVSTYNGESAF